MLPRFSTNNLTNRTLANAVLAAQRFQSVAVFMSATNIKYIRIAQLGGSVPLDGVVTILYFAVSHVVRVGSEEQVVGSDTKSIVTGMTDEESFRNGTVAKFKRDAMGKGVPPPLVGSDSVTTFLFRAYPRPTAASFIYLRPEPCGERRPAPYARTLQATVMRKALAFTQGVADIAGLGLKGLSANVADAINFLRFFGDSIGVHVGTSLQVLACQEVGRCERRGLILFA
jgi:hypothetical protein